MAVKPIKYTSPPPVIKNRDWRVSLIYRVETTEARIDITNYTFACEFRYHDYDDSPAATATVTKTDAAEGEFNIHVSDTITDGLDYVYRKIKFALKVTEPGGDICDYIYGTCEMRRSATE